MVKRFHADPRVQATELLLQERVPRDAAITQPRPVEETRAAGPAPAQALRRFRSPHTLWPHAQFLSNGSYTTVVTNAGGGASFCRGRVVTRHREDATRDPGASSSISGTCAAGRCGPLPTASDGNARRTTTW